MTDRPASPPYTSFSHTDNPTPRRHFLTLATCSAVGVGAAGFVWPFLESLAPPPISEASPVDVDLNKIDMGQQITMIWGGRPVLVVKRSSEALNTLQNTTLLDRLRDPNSKDYQQPDYAQNWHRSIRPDIGVLIGICTHLGCVPSYSSLNLMAHNQVKSERGYKCACHGSQFDLAGRVFRGAPAPYNLPVPPYHFPQDHILRIGQNPAGKNFSLNDIRQL